jgi:putative thioredoxin
MINVTTENFEIEVIAASHQVPVLVDFWAPWCGPCKVIGPLLEKVELEYAGRFKLVKIDSDQQQELSQAFGIRSIPTCVLMVGGKPVDGFQGAVPESQLKAFLDKHLPSEAELEAQSDTEDAQALMAAGDPQAALHKLHEALSINPGNDDARYDYVRLLIEQDMLEDAGAALAPALAEIPRQLRFEALGQFLDAINFTMTDERGTWAPAQFDALIATNKRDFDTRLAKARVLMVGGDWTGAMEELLEIIMRDKAWGDAVPRKTYVAILELLTPPKPKAGPQDTGKTAGGIEVLGKVVADQDPQAQLVSTYRRKLSMALN